MEHLLQSFSCNLLLVLVYTAKKVKYAHFISQLMP